MKYVERIRQLRKENSYNQTTVANILGVAQTTYSDYENGKLRMPVEHLLELAKFYNVDMNYITSISNIKHMFPSIENNSQSE